MTLADVHLFESQEKFFLINPELMRIDALTSMEHQKISAMRELDDVDAVFEGRELARRLNLFAEDTKAERLECVNTKISISKIAIFLAQDCNLNCVYCYGSEDSESVGGTYGQRGMMSLTTAITSVDWLIENSGDREKIGIVFFGGEPLLNFELLKEVVSYANSKAALASKEIVYSITTNGTLLDSEKIKYLKANNIQVTISMDGGKRIQDKQRPLPSGQGSYDLIAKKVQALLKEIPEADCRGTIMDDSDVEEAELALKQLGFKTVHLTVVSKSLLRDAPPESYVSSNSDSDPRFLNTKETVKKEANALLSAIKMREAQKTAELVYSTAWGKKLARYSEQFVNQTKTHFPCGAGRHYVGISAKGDIFPCHRFVGSDNTRLGSIFSGEVERTTYHKTTVHHDNPNSCATCFAR